jgi:hypothetical protein
MSDLTDAVKALRAKGIDNTEYWRYYDGDHPMVYTYDRLAQIFGSDATKFVQNWCSVAVNAALERLVLQRFAVDNDPALTDRVNDLWLGCEMDVDVDDVHESMLVTGEAFVFVWKSPDGRAEAYANHASLCELFYEESNPRKKRYGAKWWFEESLKGWRLNLYYRERIEYYFRKGELLDASFESGFEPYPVDGVTIAKNPYDEIPIFHFRKSRRGRKSELKDLIPIQKGVNKLFSDMMVAGEFGAFPQRWVISNADISKLKNAPNELWDLPGSDGEGQETSVGQLPATNLQNYWQTIEKLVEAAASVSRTPHYYFFKTGTSDLGGEALIALESALVKKVKRYIKQLQNEWQKMIHFMLLVDGEGLDNVERVRVVYASPETIQPYTQAQVRQLNVASGIPLITQLRNDGWSKGEIDQLIKDVATMKKSEELSLAEAMAEAQRRFDQGGSA